LQREEKKSGTSMTRKGIYGKNAVLCRGRKGAGKFKGKIMCTGHSGGIETGGLIEGGGSR